MDVVLGVLLGVVLTASALAVSRLLAPRRVLSPGEEGVRAALHAAAATLPHLRSGLTRESAGKAIGNLHALTQAAGVLIDDGETVLASRRRARRRPAAGCRTPTRVAVERGPDPFGNTVVAPLIVGGRADRAARRVLRARAPAAAGGHARGRARPRASSRAQVELSALAEQEERLAQAELRALRAQISPHFIYNALAAVATTSTPSPRRRASC